MKTKRDKGLAERSWVNIAILLFLIVLLSFLYRDLKISKMWAFGDLVPFPTNLGTTSNWVFSVWNVEGLGLVLFKPFNYYLSIFLSSFVLGAFAAQKALFLSALGFSFLSFYILLRKLKLNLTASILGALAYSFNPVTISELVGGSVTLVIYSIFPIIFYYVVKIIQADLLDLKDLVTLGLLGFFLFNLHSAFWYVTILVPLLIINMRQSSANLKKTLRLAVPCLIIIFILLPNVLGYAYFNTAIRSVNVSLESEASYCYEDATFYNIVRLSGDKGSAQAEGFLDFNTLNFYTILGYALPAIAFLFFPLGWGSRSHRRDFIILSLGVSFLVSSGLIMIIKAMPFIVDLNPILGTLRNPIKLFYPLSFSLCFLFAEGVEKLLIGLRKGRHQEWNVIAGFSLIAIILLSNYPAVDGTMGFAKVRDSSYYIEDKYYAMPDILNRIDPDYVNYRVLMLPWEYPTALFAASQMPNYFGMPLGSGLTSDIRWLKDAFEFIAAQNSTERSYLLGLFGVRYVVIDRGFQSQFEDLGWYQNLKEYRSYLIYESYYSYWATGEPSYYYQVFKTDSNFELMYENHDFAIFRNENAVSKIHVRSSSENLSFLHASISENLLKNPSFDNLTESWLMWPNTLVSARDGAIVLFGQEKWWTALYQTVFVQENALYKLRFSVKCYNLTDIHAKVLWYNITENLAEDNAFLTDYIDLYKMSLKEGEWASIEEVFSVPKEAKRAMIWFGANRLGNFTSTATYIDDVSFNEVELTVENFDNVFPSITNVNYTRISPTKYTARVTASAPLVLALSETYDPSWICYVNNQKYKSFLLYGAVNGFWINQTGQLEVAVEYEPQQLFFVGAMVSVATLVACSVYLMYDYLKNKAIWKRVNTFFHGKQRKRETDQKQSITITRL